MGNISQMALNLIDTAMVSRLSHYHLAASALVNNLVGFPFVLSMGFAVAISPLVAELKGGGKESRTGILLNNAMALNLVVCTVAVGILYLFRNIIHHLNQDPLVAELGSPYLGWMLWSIVPMIAFLSIKNFCDGLNHTRVPMIISLLSIPANAFLNYLLIFGNFGFPKLELTGAGLATFITRLLMAIAMGIYLLSHSKYKVYYLNRRRIIPSKLNKIIRLAVPTAWQYCSEIGAFVILGIMVGWFGAIQQAAHQISLSVAALTFMVSIGLSSAGSIKVGEAYGAKDNHLARITGLLVFKMAILYGLVCAFVFIVFKNWIPLVFTTEKEVIAHASTLFVLAAAFQLGDSMQAVGIGVLRGMQDVKWPTIYTTLCYWFIGIPSGYLFSVHFDFQVIGIWLGFIFCLSTMGFLLLRRFLNITREFKGKSYP